jgi:hypothetical protein
MNRDHFFLEVDRDSFLIGFDQGSFSDFARLRETMNKMLELNKLSVRTRPSLQDRPIREQDSKSPVLRRKQALTRPSLQEYF